MAYGLYHCYEINIADYQEFPKKQKPNEKKNVSKHASRVPQNKNHSLRKNGSLKQPGGASCNQRR